MSCHGHGWNRNSAGQSKSCCTPNNERTDWVRTTAFVILGCILVFAAYMTFR
jgi:hypothetical protein